MNREKLTQFQLIVDNMPSIAWMKDKEGRYLVINKLFANFGIKNNIEILGKRDAEVFSQSVCNFYEMERQAIASKTPQTADQLYESAAGSVWYDTYIAPVLGADGEVAGTIGFARRITRRKKLELELERQRAFLKTMIDTIPDFIFYKDVNSILLGCNKAALERLYGVSETEAVGKNILDIVEDTNFAQECLANDWDVLATGRTVKNEEKAKLVDGSVIEFETIKTPFYNDDGKIAGLLGISRDITARKRLERQLKESQERYAAIINSAPEIVLIHSKGIIKFINTVGVKAFGYPRSEIIGSHIYTYLAQSSRLKAKQIMVDISNEERSSAYDIEFVNQAGEVRNGLVRTAPITLGGQLAHLAVLMDVTDKKRIEAKLWESEERFRQVAENINEVLMIMDEDKFLYISPAFARITGRSIQCCIDNPRAFAEIIIYPDDRERLLYKFIQNRHCLEETSDEFRFLRADGDIRWALVRSYPIHSRGESSRLRAITLVDITERKRIEEQLRQKDEQLQREIEFAARVQEQSLPAPFANTRVRINPVFVPYNSVSGDLINYRWFEQQQKLRGYVVDVSGHGMATALQTATVKMLLDDQLLGGGEIDEAVFQQINKSMLIYLYEESFAGLMYFEFDFTTGLLTVITGGIHFFLNGNSQGCELIPVFSGYLGMFAEAQVQTKTMPFKPGETYCMMSDGASDLLELFGTSPQENFAGYVSWFQALSRNPERTDDFSVICVETIAEAALTSCCDIRTPAELTQAQTLIAKFLAHCVPAGDVLFEVAVNEAVNNGLAVGRQVRLTLKKTGRRLVVRVKDQGAGFCTQPLAGKTGQDIDRAFEQLGLSERGRGIMMMKMFCDRLCYNAQGNEVLLMKKI